ncbi:MAG TPA: hypothetical protein VK011_01885 [Acidimicrobiia bacterium]|nr:hypothetical protein [Acidimicrobiia bacterium]
MSTPQSSASSRFSQVNIVVSDMERSLAFYRLLGVEIDEMDGGVAGAPQHDRRHSPAGDRRDRQ